MQLKFKFHLHGVSLFVQSLISEVPFSYPLITYSNPHTGDFDQPAAGTALHFNRKRTKTYKSPWNLDTAMVLIQYKDRLSRHMDYYFTEKASVRLSYIFIGISLTGKATSF